MSLKNILANLKVKIAWAVARADLEELQRWRDTHILYRQWLSEFKDVSVVLDNLGSTVSGKESLDASYPPSPQGPWTIENLRFRLRYKKRVVIRGQS